MKTRKNSVIIQIAVKRDDYPAKNALRKWATCAMQAEKEPSEVTIRIVDEAEMTELNETYRHKKGPTNVLSFPFEAPIDMDVNLLGDIVICAAIVNAEAKAQGKTADAHWAHMVIHGILHLQGYDHIEEDEAEVMEALEVTLLQTLGYTNPYIDGHKVE